MRKNSKSGTAMRSEPLEELRCSPEFWEAFVREFLPLITAACSRILRNPSDAEDATQNALELVFKNLPNFRQESRPTTWVYHIAQNAALDILRRRKARRSLLHDDLSQVLEQGDGNGRSRLSEVLTAPSPEQEFAAREIWQDVAKRLSPQELLMVELRAEGYEMREIAEALGLLENAVRTKFFRLREKLPRSAQRAWLAISY